MFQVSAGQNAGHSGGYVLGQFLGTAHPSPSMLLLPASLSRAALARGGAAQGPVLRLMHCLSIHKCQGSEFPCTILITHKSHEFLQHRNLLYRAQETAVILGGHRGIQSCARRRQVDRRTKPRIECWGCDSYRASRSGNLYCRQVFVLRVIVATEQQRLA